MLDVDGFRDRVQKGAAAAKEKGESTAFFEKEVARQLDCFGNVCQAFSTYEARRAPSDEKPFVERHQQHPDRQRRPALVGRLVVWDTERADNPIPPEYQKK